jgi:hypothetical protein
MRNNIFLSLSMLMLFVNITEGKDVIMKKQRHVISEQSYHQVGYFLLRLLAICGLLFLQNLLIPRYLFTLRHHLQILYG